MIATLREFIRLEAAGGVVLMVAAIAALVWANSPAAPAYEALWHARLPFTGASVADAINDGLMALFFLLVGAEIKREMLEGELAGLRRSALPLIAAAGGMAVPAAIYAAFNWPAFNGNDAVTLRGWAIPSATDIAFALGVLTLLGPRVPVSLKAFLLALAILDDLGAILIIAVFYAADLSWPALALASACVAVLIAMNRMGAARLAPYLVVGALLWLAVLHSGLHPTVAGVVLAMTIPLQVMGLQVMGRPAEAPLLRLEYALHPWVVFGILPLFALANAGVALAGLSLGTVAAPVPLGIAVGLFAGKQVGVLAAVWASVRLGISPMPAGASWTQVYGVAVLTGIGFTMSLFLGLLAFEGHPEYGDDLRLGVLGGSLLSAVGGYSILRWCGPKRR